MRVDRGSLLRPTNRQALLSDAVYVAEVAKQAPSEKNIVLFNAGGQGSGKTTSLRHSGKSEQAFIIMDGTMQDMEKSRRNIELAFKEGKRVHINFVFCPFSKAILNIIMRASDLNGGRVVNVRRVAKGHYQALENMFNLVAKYQSVFSYSVVDNSAGLPRRIDLEVLVEKRYPSVDALELERYILADDHFASFKESDESLSDRLYQRLKG